jgi:2-keto-3-deoxy-L-rhamnonate aldolase RhmA
LIYNTFLKKLREGKILLNCQAWSRLTMIAKIFGLTGLDYVFFEGEHFPWNTASLAAVIQACDGAEINSIARIPQNNPGMILQMLDAGASGVITPYVDNRANAFVMAGKYVPVGDRGISSNSRTAQYGFIDKKTYFETANKDTALIVLIESKAVENIDDILHIAPKDLAYFYGIAVASKKNKEIIVAVIAVTNKVDILAGCPAETVEHAKNI